MSRHAIAPWASDPADLSWLDLPVYSGADLIGHVEEEGPGRVRVSCRWIDVGMMTLVMDRAERSTRLELGDAARVWWEVSDVG